MKKVQAIRCKCGAIFAACREPECYTETDWMRDVRKWVKQGCTVELLESVTFGRCTCNGASIRLFNTPL